MITIRLINLDDKNNSSDQIDKHYHHHQDHKQGDIKNPNQEFKIIGEKNQNLLQIKNDPSPRVNKGQYEEFLKNIERIVHIDLKGAPPKPDYFTEFIPFIKKHGATGILLEYEDTFPFTGKLAEAKNGHGYTLEDVNMIKRLAKDNGLSIMPLVQTYGHLEWLLKIKSFAHLREAADFPQVISPCLEESYNVLFGKLNFNLYCIVAIFLIY